MIHVYCGDGKGKTTSAMGLALRALGRGWPVAICQFLKDGTSGEVGMLEREGARVFHVTPPVKFTSRMSAVEREATHREHDANLREVIDLMQDGHARLVVLDELCAALRADLASPELVREALALAASAEEGPELVVTGRNPPEFVLDVADYITEMRCVRHPFEHGVVAREGVEY